MLNDFYILNVNWILFFSLITFFDQNQQNTVQATICRWMTSALGG